MRRAGGIAAVALLVAGAFALGFLLTPAPRGEASFPPRPAVEPRQLVPLVVDEVRAELLSSYYEAVDEDVLAETTVEDMIAALDDPHTEYLTAREYDSLTNRTARSYSGVGLTVGPAKGGLIVTSALKGPAREAGIRPGDVIISIDGQPAAKLPFDRSLALIKGERGTIVHLEVKRPKHGTIKFSVVRSEIAVPALRARMIKTQKRKLGYVRLLSFPGSAAERLLARTSALVESGAEGLILDLRDNPGGLLAQAVSVSSIFLREGTVCSVEGIHQARRVYTVTGSATHPRLPLVVLVNEHSASAAEIVAAALAENERATLVGHRTFGKASVQSVRPLSNGGALKLTTAIYLTPSGANLTHRGIEPEVEAVDDPLTRPDEAVVAAGRALVELLPPT